MPSTMFSPLHSMRLDRKVNKLGKQRETESRSKQTDIKIVFYKKFEFEPS